MAYSYGKFVWFELVTPNVDDAKAFWTAVAGLGTSQMAAGDGTYLMLNRGAATIGGVVAPQMDGVPPQWTAYLSVDDVAAKAAAVTANGGRVLVPPTDIGMGVFALVADPGGATFNLWHGKDGDDNGATGVHWVELWAKDAGASAAFYQKVFGFGHQLSQMAQGPYHLLTVGERQMAGIMASHDPKVPPMWLVYLEVADVASVVANVRKHGGAVHAEPMTVDGIGTFAVVADRQGATVGVIQPAPR
ncbi:MAG: VOC family protein [Myxococcota bacterium]